MFRRKTVPATSLWIPTHELPTTPANTFYARLDEALTTLTFGDQVRALCQPYYVPEAGQGGQPGVDPEVYFKMLMIGFFENLASERGIAARCADSLAIRAFLHYSLTEPTPDHSTLSVIRQRLGPAVYEQVFALVLRALKQHGLLKGKRLAIDASVLEANASLRSLEHRLTGEAYADYVKRLAAAAGVDPADAAAVRRFDRKRKKKTSNTEWHNPHDPDARIGPTKRGNIEMIFKPEHVVDLDTGAIVDADVRPGDAADQTDLADRVEAVEARLHAALGDPPETRRLQILVADKGYYTVEELVALHGTYVDTAIPDPVPTRCVERLEPAEQRAVAQARQTVQSARGRGLRRRCGELLERSFQHVLDWGGARQTTLRGRANIRKRYLIQAACANLSLLLRQLLGVGTPKQALAGAMPG